MAPVELKRYEQGNRCSGDSQLFSASQFARVARIKRFSQIRGFSLLSWMPRTSPNVRLLVGADSHVARVVATHREGTEPRPDVNGEIHAKRAGTGPLAAWTVLKTSDSMGLTWGS
jgi:hypothetical protein